MRAVVAAEAAVPVVLASASRSRAMLLGNAGVDAVRDPAAIDEEEVKASFRAEGADAATVAQALAELKAQRVSGRHPGALVIGVDQMLDCNGVWFDKPVDRPHARAHPAAPRGRTHELIAARAAAIGRAAWREGMYQTEKNAGVARSS